MRLTYLLISLFIFSLMACVSDPKPDQVVTEKAVPTAPAAPAKAPQVKVNPDSPAFGSKKTMPAQRPTAPEQATKQADTRGRGTDSDPSSKEYQDKQRAIKEYKDKQRANISTSASTTSTKAQPVKKATGKGLPHSCHLMTEAYIGKVIGVDPGYISVKDGSGKTATTQSSCFFRWDHEGQGNTGVLIQVQTNPLPDEFEDWASYYISAKRNQGDKSPDGASTYRYKEFLGIGVAGAYNYDLSRYYWRDTKDRVFMVAFNLPSTEEEQLAWAGKLAKEVMRNAN